MVRSAAAQPSIRRPVPATAVGCCPRTGQAPGRPPGRSSGGLGTVRNRPADRSASCPPARLVRTGAAGTGQPRPAALLRRSGAGTVTGAARPPLARRPPSRSDGRRGRSGAAGRGRRRVRPARRRVRPGMSLPGRPGPWLPVSRCGSRSPRLVSSRHSSGERRPVALEILGLDGLSESVYRALLADPDADLAALAGRLGTDEPAVRKALRRLVELSLVRERRGRARLRPGQPGRRAGRDAVAGAGRAVPAGAGAAAGQGRAGPAGPR